MKKWHFEMKKLVFCRNLISLQAFKCKEFTVSDSHKVQKKKIENLPQAERRNGQQESSLQPASEHLGVVCTRAPSWEDALAGMAHWGLFWTFGQSTIKHCLESATGSQEAVGTAGGPL